MKNPLNLIIFLHDFFKDFCYLCKGLVLLLNCHLKRDAKCIKIKC